MVDTTGTIDPNGDFQLSAPMPLVMRLFLGGAGIFILVMSIRELARGVWPLNLFSLPFLVILVGAVGIGGVMLAAGLVAPSLSWTIRRGRVEIDSRTPFGRHRYSFAAPDVSGFALSEYEGDGGPSTFKVVMTTASGKRFESGVLRSRPAADDLKRRMEQAFYG